MSDCNLSDEQRKNGMRCRSFGCNKCSTFFLQNEFLQTFGNTCLRAKGRLKRIGDGKKVDIVSLLQTLSELRGNIDAVIKHVAKLSEGQNGN